jgi:hypothetical protein
MPLEQWLDFAYKYGLPPAMLGFFVYALHKGWIVMGRTHEKIVGMLEDANKKQEARGDKWESRAEGLLERAASSAQAAERAVAKVTGEDEAPRARRGAAR